MVEPEGKTSQNTNKFKANDQDDLMFKPDISTINRNKAKIRR